MDKSDIVKAWKFLRDNNSDISDSVIDFMKDAAIEKLAAQTAQADEKTCPECGGSNGGHYFTCSHVF